MARIQRKTDTSNLFIQPLAETQKTESTIEQMQTSQTEKKEIKKLYNIRLTESDRNIIASTFQHANGLNFTEGVKLAGLFVAELYKQNKIVITKEGITLK